MGYTQKIENLWQLANKQESVERIETEYHSLLSDSPYIEEHLRSLGKGDLLKKLSEIKLHIEDYYKEKEKEKIQARKLDRIIKQKKEMEEEKRKKEEKRKRERQIVRKIVEERKIPYLVHFTRWENLDCIFQHGLCPRILLENLPCETTINDELRLDGHEDSVSLSIAFPNYKMFYSYRANTQTRGWAVIALSTSVLWEHECAFCKHNAADSRVFRVAVEKLKAASAFKSMFDEDDRYKLFAEFHGEDSNLETRENNRLKSFDPTDPQAEVLVFDVIPPDKIIGVAFENGRLLNEFREKYPYVKAVNKNYYFSARCYVR